MQNSPFSLCCEHHYCLMPEYYHHGQKPIPPSAGNHQSTLAITDNSAMNIHVFMYKLLCGLGVELLAHMVILFLTF